MIDGENIHEAITDLRASIQAANRRWDDQLFLENEWANASWYIEQCFIKLLAIVESLGLSQLHDMILSEYISIKETGDGFLASGNTPDGESYSTVTSKLRQFLGTIQQFFPSDEPTRVTKDLLQIIRDIHYTITDTALFQDVPQNEKDVHLRIEGILKCVFPDLKHEPTLTKQVKSFKPDTGIPSTGTLIEYKYLARKDDIKVIADQILADTRGFTSRDWKTVVYVIYETKRLKREEDWVTLLRESGVPENTTVVVLSGEPPTRSRRS